jgi:hypothetical protein
MKIDFPIPSTSGTDTYTASFNPTLTAYETNQIYYVKFVNANTGAATLNVNGLGAKSVVKTGSTALASGDIKANQIVALTYDGTNFQLLGGGGGSGGGISGLTTNELVYGDSATTIASLAVATYPNLTELSYLKGVTAPLAPNATKQFFFQFTTTATPADATNYQFSQIAQPFIITDQRRVKFAKAGTIKSIWFTLAQAVQSTSELSTLYFRNVTTNTDTLIGTFDSSLIATNSGGGYLFGSLSIAYNATDDYNLRITTPTWVTNPTNWNGAATLDVLE